MPPIANTIAEELLPLLFRRKQRRPMLGNDLPEQGGFGGNLLAPVQDPAPPIMVPPGMNPSQVAMVDETRPRITQPRIPSQVTPSSVIPPETIPNSVTPAPVTPAPVEPNALVSRSGQVMDEYSTRPARRVETDSRGRPTRNVALEGDDQTLDYANRVSTYEPQEGGGGWWPKIRAAIAGFAAGGPVGAAAAFGTRALRERFEPKLNDQEWKAQQMGQVAPAVESIGQSRKDQRAEEAQDVNIEYTRARTDALKREKKTAGRIVERSDGVYMINAETGKAEKVAGIPPEAGRPGATRYVSRPDGVYGINAEHPQGFKVGNIPGNAGKDAEDVTFGNQQLSSVIAEAQAEQKKIDQALPGIPMTIEATDILTGQKKQVANPEYTYNMTRRRQLDDQIRRWRTQMKSPKKKAAATESDDPLGILNDDEDDQ